MSKKQPTFKGQKILFHFSFSHFPGSYQNEGWFIDSEGKIKTYSISANHDDWNFPEDESFTEERLLGNYLKARDTDEGLNLNDLEEMYDLIDPSKQGPYSELEFLDSEEGSASFYCFDFDPEKKVYQRVVLKKSGDFSQENLNEKAAQLYSRLVEINKNIEKKLGS